MDWLEVTRNANGRWQYAVWDTSYSDSFPAACGGGYPTELDAMREGTAVKRERFERFHMSNV